ncbi:MAG: hypothetical protein IJ808_00560, partial [Muribaculaceae bacterium]|nr:hypothetical protein [Muribaculaceae bacterium]
VGAVFLLVVGRKTRGLYGPAVQWMVAVATFALALFISWQGYFVQPLLDFRPYKIGTKLLATAPSDEAQDYLFVYEKQGEIHEFTIDDVPDEEDGWTFVARKPIAPSRPDLSEGRQFAIVDGDSDDVSADVLTGHGRTLLFLFPDLDEVNVAGTFALNELRDDANAHGFQVFGLTSASKHDIAEWNDISMADYPMFIADDSDIKMMARGNPAVVCLDGDTIVWKRTLQSIPMSKLQDPAVDLLRISDDFNPATSLRTLLLAYLAVLLLILAVNRTHLIFRLKSSCRKRREKEK